MKSREYSTERLKKAPTEVFLRNNQESLSQLSEEDEEIEECHNQRAELTLAPILQIMNLINDHQLLCSVEVEESEEYHLHRGKQTRAPILKIMNPISDQCLCECHLQSYRRSQKWFTLPTLILTTPREMAKDTKNISKQFKLQ